MSLRHLSDLDVKGKRVILRSDLNVPIKAGQITDDGRIRASLPTMRHLLDRGASLVVLAHLGRPKGERNPDLSLAPVAARLEELIGRKVAFARDVTEASMQAERIQPGEIVMVENIRYEAAETSKEVSQRAELASKLARCGDIYVGDGFGAVHRKHASVFELAEMLPHAAGLLVEEEVKVLENLTGAPSRPYAVVLGGAKVSDKIAVIRNLVEKVDVLLIGGGMLFTFLAAQGLKVGKSLLEEDQIDTVNQVLERAKERGVEVLLPTDILVSKEFKDLPPRRGLDLGDRRG